MIEPTSKLVTGKHLFYYKITGTDGSVGEYYVLSENIYQGARIVMHRRTTKDWNITEAKMLAGFSRDAALLVEQTYESGEVKHG